MARKTSTVLLMMTGTLVLLAAVVGLGLMFVSDYDAMEYEYEVTGTHEVAYGSGTGSWNLNGTVSTTYMNIFGVTKVTTTSDISYADATEVPKKYDLAGKWNFFSKPDIGTMIDINVVYATVNHGEQYVDIYEINENNEVIKRWVGHEDGIVYRLERTITNGELETHIIQDLISYKETKMPFKI